MKILVLNYEYPPIGGGAANASKYLVEEWCKLGHDVVVLTSHYEGLDITETHSTLKIIRVPVGRKSLVKARVREMLAYLLKGLWTASKLCKNERFDVCVPFFGIPSGPIALWLKRKYRIPYSVQLRGGDVPGFDPKKLFLYHGLTSFLIRWVWKNSDAAIANSLGLADLAKKTDSEIQFKVIPNGVDIDSYFPDPNKKKNKIIQVINVGRFSESQKNILMILKSLLTIPSIELKLVGGGPDEIVLREFVSSNRLENRVHFAGWLKGKELIKAYQCSDIYVSASRWEGMPNTVLESMSTGLPVILSRIAGHEELAVNNQNGLLFTVDDQQGLNERIQKLAENESLRASMGEQSRRFVENKYLWNQMAQKHESILSSIIRI